MLADFFAVVLALIPYSTYDVVPYLLLEYFVNFFMRGLRFQSEVQHFYCMHGLFLCTSHSCNACTVY